MNASKQSHIDSPSDLHPRDSNPSASKVVNMNHSTANMLHRTSRPEAAPPDARPWYERAERLDYLAIERIAREMRSDYVATLFSRWARTLHTVLAGRRRHDSRKAALAP